MDFVSKPKRRRVVALQDDNNQWSSDKKTDLPEHLIKDMFYQYPPIGDVSLIDVEEMCFLRLKVLREIEAKRDVHGKNSSELWSSLNALSTNADFQSFPFLPQTSDETRVDHLSHFMLRLAFCRSPEAQKWFIQHELDLFKFRLQQKTSDQLTDCLRSTNTTFQLVGKDEKTMYQNELMGAAPNTKSQFHFVEHQDYWKIDFLDACDLVGQRRVFVRAGEAYVPKSDLDVIISSKFRHASKHFGAVADEERVLPILKKLSKNAYMGKDYTNTQGTDVITPSMIDDLAEKSFPLCMRSMHEELRSKHHLKHGARMQYGLFLKGIGLTLEGALAFFRQEFTKAIDAEKFEKQYAYNIRHNYGKEGKRANYTPYHCAKIITTNPPAAGDCHGCPFKHWDVEHVSKQLTKMNIASDRVKAITSMVKDNRFDRACTRVFEATHGMPTDSCDQLITHPNQYFDMSRQLAKGASIKQKTITAETAVSFSQSQSPLDNSSLTMDENDEDDALIDSMISSQTASQVL